MSDLAREIQAPKGEAEWRVAYVPFSMISHLIEEAKEYGLLTDEETERLRPGCFVAFLKATKAAIAAAAEREAERERQRLEELAKAPQGPRFFVPDEEDEEI